jgi:hypothetical protein
MRDTCLDPPHPQNRTAADTTPNSVRWCFMDIPLESFI